MTRVLAALLLVVLAYVASPYAAVALVLRAVKQGDEQALAARIDFDALRASLTPQLEARMTPPGQAPSPLLATLVNSFVTPAGFASMLRGRGALPFGGASASSESSDPGTALSLDGLDLRWFFFTGPARFEVRSERGAIVLEPRGTWWRVVDVKLPPQPDGPPLPAPVPPAPAQPPDLEVPDFGTPAPAAGS